MPKSKAPSFQFYPGDWRSDGALHGCSIGARGMWIEMICLMHDSPKYGYLLRPDGTKFPEDQMLRTMGVCEGDYLTHMSELRSAGVFSETSEGIVFSRRMIRDEENRREWRKCKQHQRSSSKVVHRDVHQLVHHDVQSMSRGSPSSSPSSNLNTSPLPPKGGEEAILKKCHKCNFEGLSLAGHECTAPRKGFGQQRSNGHEQTPRESATERRAREANEQTARLVAALQVRRGR